MTDKPPPKALALIICDTVIHDKATNKKSLIGLFNCVYSKVFPCKLTAINVFVSLTEGRGTYQCSLICVKDDESQTLVRMGGPLTFNNPLAVIEAKFEIKGLVFPEAGTYRFEFLCQDIPVISRKFQLVKLERKDHESYH